MFLTRNILKIVSTINHTMAKIVVPIVAGEHSKITKIPNIKAIVK